VSNFTIERRSGISKIWLNKTFLALDSRSENSVEVLLVCFVFLWRMTLFYFISKSLFFVVGGFTPEVELLYLPDGFRSLKTIDLVEG
jgi:hypothetical protein